MMVKYLLAVIFGLLTIATNAQLSSKQQRIFYSYNTLQILSGSTTTSLAVHSVNGLQFNLFFAGAGLGVDYYYHTTIPFFLEGRINLMKTKRTLQLFAQGGISIPLSAPNNKLEINRGTYNPGSMYAAGIDYCISIGNDALILGAAFNNKQVVQMVENNIWNPVLNRIENVPRKDNYALNRVAIRAGWRF